MNQIYRIRRNKSFDLPIWVVVFFFFTFFASCEKDTESVNFAPKVTTGTAVGIFRNDATLSGSIQIPEGTAVSRYGILLSELQGMEEYVEYPVTDNATHFSIQFDGLKPGTTYYYCTFATSGVSWEKGDIKSFTTVANTSPSLGELQLLEKGITNCKLSVNLKDNGGTGVSLSGFCWIEGEEGEPTIDDKLQSIQMADSIIAGTIENLEPNTTYRIRAYATNATGTGYSNTLVVTTDNLPIPIVGEITLVDSEVLAVTLSAQVVELHDTELRGIGFCWGTENQQPNISNQLIDLTEQIGEEYFVGTIKDLSPSTTYYIRAYATNEAGTGYSKTYVHTTGEIQVPVLSEVQITNSTNRSIDLTAMVEEPGSSDVQKIGYCWSTETETPTTGNFFVDLSEQLGQSEFTTTISDLTPSTTYYIRAYAENKQGVGYSETLTYTTEEDQSIQGTEGSVHLNSAGFLSDYIPDYNKYNITKLKISGSINGTDVRLLREMAGSRGKLTELDLSEATIVEGGDIYYTSSENYNYTTFNNVLGDFFFCNTQLKNIVLPKGIDGIGQNAFMYCTSLTQITIPDGVQRISTAVFRGCTSLTNVVFPSGLTYIGDYVFDNCSSLAHITIPDGIKKIENDTFRGCSSLSEINLPNGITSIGSDAFMDCSSLTQITIPDGVTSIGSNAFYNCSSLTDIVIPNGVTLIDSYTFSDCSSLADITIPDGVTSIGEYAFRDCLALVAINIPGGIKSIGSGAFNGCSSLVSVSLPDGITSIDSYTFSGCSSLTDIIIPDGVTSIGFNAFMTCSSLTDIDIPAGVTSIGECAFWGCSSLVGITIPDGVMSISEAVFIDCSSLVDVTLPDGIISIGSYAFSGCSSLTDITMPDKLTSIGESSFSRCSLLTEIVIPTGVTSIGEWAFSECSSLIRINIPDGVMSIGECGFYKCSSLTSIIIPNAVTSIGDDAFRQCYSLSKVTCKASTPPNIGSCAFESIAEFPTLLVPAGCVDAYSESDWGNLYFSTIKEME